ncbi:MAG TPA: fibronectin type III domain-containing protein, partial [Humibacillus sp.]|nr:fibronectin type III domain-containing protein [Humibacillus sp.]
MRRVRAFTAVLLLLGGGTAPGFLSSPSAASAAGSTRSAATASGGSVVAGGLVPLPAHRLLDTRSGLGAPKGAVAAGKSLTLAVAGREGVPLGVTTVAITVTAVSPTAAGFVTAHAHGTPTPTASSLNFASAQTTPNLVVAQLSPDGLVDLTVGGSGTVHLLADVAGYVSPGVATDAATLRSLPPTRLLDTRSGLGAPQAAVAGGATVTLRVSGRGGVPTTGAGSVVLNVTATGSTAAGYVAVATRVSGSPATSSLNYAKAQTRANLVVVPLTDLGTVDLRVVSSGTVHLIADVVGWVAGGVPTLDGTLTAVSPVRLLDTRASGDSLANHEWATVDVVDVAGVPLSGVSSVLLNVTATGATASGNLSVLPNGPGLPTGTNLNFVPGRTEANLVLAPVSPEGYVDVFATTSGSVHVVVDVAGYVLGEPLDTTAPDGVTGLTTSQPAKNSIALGWTNPSDTDLAGVTIRRVTGSTPSDDPLAGQVVAETTGTSFTDTGLTPGTSYSYSVWAHDGFPNVAPPAQATATTTALVWDTPSVVAPYVGAPSALSCPTSTWCLSGDWFGRTQTWNGTSWSARTTVLDVAREEDMGGFYAIGCASTTFCAASVLDGGLAVYAQGVWGAAARPTLPADVGGWNDVDCVSTTFCIAVNGSGYVTRFNGSTWSAPVRTAGYY